MIYKFSNVNQCVAFSKMLECTNLHNNIVRNKIDVDDSQSFHLLWLLLMGVFYWLSYFMLSSVVGLNNHPNKECLANKNNNAFSRPIRCQSRLIVSGSWLFPRFTPFTLRGAAKSDWLVAILRCCDWSNVIAKVIASSVTLLSPYLHHHLSIRQTSNQFKNINICHVRHPLSIHFKNLVTSPQNTTSPGHAVFEHIPYMYWRITI